jgi:hypothetical protein
MEGMGMDGAIADAGALASLENKHQLVRDRVTAVAKGYSTGLYIYGTGGVGKTYTVLQQLERLKISFKLFNSRMTARGLFRALEKAPEAVHVLEDMERLTNDRDAQCVLRSALWSQPGRDRVVTWTTGTGGEEHFVFRGGIILLANRPLADLPELRALATRISVMRLEVTDAELEALMRDLAASGYGRDGKQLLEQEKCREVTEHLIRECQTAGCPLDLRLQANSYLDYLLWEADHAACGWQDLVTARVHEAARHFRQKVSNRSPEERKAECREIVREILRQTSNVEEQVGLDKERTGRSRTDFFRKKAQVQSGEFEGEEGAV